MFKLFKIRKIKREQCVKQENKRIMLKKKQDKIRLASSHYFCLDIISWRHDLKIYKGVKKVLNTGKDKRKHS